MCQSKESCILKTGEACDYIYGYDCFYVYRYCSKCDIASEVKGFEWVETRLLDEEDLRINLDKHMQTYDISVIFIKQRHSKEFFKRFKNYLKGRLIIDFKYRNQLDAIIDHSKNCV